MALITEGIININKPAEWTSHDCVAVMRRVLGIKKIGHTGTLDPMATGVLPICIGTSARIMEYLDLDFKTYCCTMKLGVESDTCDIWGNLTEPKDCSGITEAEIREAFAPFAGHVSQIPPKYAAIKVDGKKLYQYARAGEEVEIKPRNIYIRDLTIESIDLERREIVYSVTCSKGTYIRSICRDVGETLGCGAVMTGLRRTASGAFLLEDAVDLQELRQMDPEEIARHVLPTDFPLTHFGKAVVNRDRAAYFCNGGHIAMKDAVIVSEPEYKEKQAHIPIRERYRKAYCLYLRDSGEKSGGETGHKDIFLGVACYSEKYKKLVADKVFFRG